MTETSFVVHSSNSPVLARSRSGKINQSAEIQAKKTDNKGKNMARICLHAAGLTRSRKISEAKLILENIGAKDLRLSSLRPLAG